MNELRWEASPGDYQAGGWRITRRWRRLWDLYRWDGKVWRHFQSGTTLRELKRVAEGQPPKLAPAVPA